MEYDLIVVGAGPAGLNAAVYAARYKLKTLVIGKVTGGVMLGAVEVCNYLGFTSIKGMELAGKMKQHVLDLGVEIKNEKVVKVLKGDNFKVKTDSASYLGKKIVFATGLERRKLDLPNEDDFLGKGISYCATCDAVMFSGKKVAVVGGGNSALTAALLLAEYAEKVYIVYRKDSFFRAEPSWIEAVEKNEKIKCVFNANVVKLIGDNFLEKVELDNGNPLDVEGVFVEIGGMPNIDLAVELGVELDGREIKVDKSCRTNIPGVFAAGDITNNPLKQIITAAAEGALAAASAYKEIKEGK